MGKDNRLRTGMVVGIDLGDKHSRICVLDEGKIVEQCSIVTREDDFRRYFDVGVELKIALEVGTHSPWASRLLKRLGHEVHVANPRALTLIHRSRRKNDKLDAERLARLLGADLDLLSTIEHRGEQSQRDLALMRSREEVMRSRTSMINHVRGVVKANGYRLPSCSADSFARQDKIRAAIPEGLRDALYPLLDLIGQLTKQIKEYDKRIEWMCEHHYPITGALRQIRGVGPLTALAFVLTIEDPRRFKRNRDVAAYLGLVPRQSQSGDSNPQLRIHKQGDKYLRRLLVSASHYILGPFGEDCDLRRHGERIAQRGGKLAKKRALVAVARKLSVLLLRLWKTGEEYDPFYNAKRAAALTQAA